MAKITRKQILGAALTLAEQTGWESLRLHQVAQQLDCSLEEIRQHFAEKEAFTDAWFDAADAAMLQRAAQADGQALPHHERMTELLMAWLAALAPHRRVTRQMIAGKFEPGHVHVSLAGLLRVSRTVQWWREAAGCRESYLLRALAEVRHTAIYSMVFAHWMWDESEHAQNTRRLLRGALECSPAHCLLSARLHASAAPESSAAPEAQGAA